MKKLACPDQKICVACGVCMGACPRAAISIHRGCHAVVDKTRCVGCSLCAVNCPASCITVERSEEK